MEVKHLFLKYTQYIHNHAKENMQILLSVKENDAYCLCCDLTACSDSLLLENLLHMVPRLKGHGRKYGWMDA
jgi:hypothetical protein